MGYGKPKQFKIHQSIFTNPKYYQNFALGLFAFLVAYCAASVLAPAEVSDAQEVTIKNDVTGYYVTVSNSDALALNVDASPTGAIATATDTINVKTNAPTGYQLYLSTSSATIYNSTDTGHTGTPLSPVSGTLSSKSALGQNTWGFTLDDASTAELQATDIWAAVPDGGETLISETSTPEYSTGVNVPISYGVKANSSLSTGTYSTTVYYTAIAEGATEEFMQDFTAAECSAMGEDDTVRLMDSRNAGIYTVVKAKDGNCWMADNLQIDDVTIYPSNSNIYSGSFYIPKSSDWAGNITDEAKLHIATNSGYEGEHYYNWFTATAGSTESTAGTTVDQSICPKGWRLPINGDATQDKSYAMLFNKYGITTGSQVVANTSLGFTYSGGWNKENPGSEVDQGTYGYFWTSTTTSADGAYGLRYNSSGALTPQYEHNKGFGFSVRCVFEGETVKDITTMQQMTGTICNNTRTGLTARLEDIRGRGNAGSAADPTYGVIKAKDGNCWMTENFDLYNTASSAVQLTSDNTDIPTKADGSVTTYTLPASSNWSGNQYTAPLVHQATNSGYTDQVYYNWCAVTATSNSTDPNCNTASQVNQSICPTGWQLPINGTNTVNKSLLKLMNAYGVTTGGNLVNPSHASYILGFRYPGNWHTGGYEYGQGTVGNPWTSTPSSSGRAYALAYSSNSLKMESDYYKGNGFVFRCVSRD